MLRYSLKIDVVHGPGENGLRDTTAELLFGPGYQVRPGLTWRETGVTSGGGWPEIEIEGTAADLIAVAHNYAGGTVDQDGGDSLLEVIQSIRPLTGKTEDLTDDYVATEGREHRPGGRYHHM